jgi:hypothetical protein
MNDEDIGPEFEKGRVLNQGEASQNEATSWKLAGGGTLVLIKRRVSGNWAQFFMWVGWHNGLIEMDYGH